jgi:hypothetical protein
MECNLLIPNLSVVEKSKINFDSFCKWLDEPNVKKEMERMRFKYSGDKICYGSLFMTRRQFADNIDNGFIEITQYKNGQLEMHWNFK